MQVQYHLAEEGSRVCVSEIMQIQLLIDLESGMLMVSILGEGGLVSFPQDHLGI